MWAKTLSHYSQTITQFLAFISCATVGGNQGPQINLVPPVLDTSLSLTQALEATHSVPACAIHQLVMAILFRFRPPGDLYACPVARFIIYMNVLPLGKIRHPADINGMLMELKWPFHASTFWEVLQRVDAGISSEELEQ